MVPESAVWNEENIFSSIIINQMKQMSEIIRLLENQNIVILQYHSLHNIYLIKIIVIRLYVHPVFPKLRNLKTRRCSIMSNTGPISTAYILILMCLKRHQNWTTNQKCTENILCCFIPILLNIINNVFNPNNSVLNVISLFTEMTINASLVDD